MTGLVPVQIPATQMSDCVQKLPSSQVPGSATVVCAMAMLFPVAGSDVLLAAPKLELSVVPSPMQTLTLTEIENEAELLAARIGVVHEIVPVPPTAGFVQVHPAAGVIDWNVVPAGVEPLI
jgi:hypothetical protein